MEKQTAKDRLAGAIMSKENRKELEAALENVLACEQRTATLKALEVVHECVVEKIPEADTTSQDDPVESPTSGLV
jgi:hypothetical protein